MFQLDNKFLEEVGLGNLPDDQKQMFLDYFREQLELRVGTRLSDGLSDAQLEEFESFIDHDEEKVNAWVMQHVPNYNDDKTFQDLKASAPEGVSQTVLLAEYSSLKWLELNRPDYKDVVARTMNELRQEIIENRDAIVGGGDLPQ